MRCFPPFPVLLIASAAFAAGAEVTVLTRVEQVRALTLNEARKHLPVRLTGVITYFDGQADHAFVTDETGGVFFRPGRQGADDLKSGERVEITGVTRGENFSPSVGGIDTEPAGAPSVRIRKLGTGSLPEPARVPFDQLRTGRWHDQFVSLRATVREMKSAPGIGPRSVSVLLSGPDGKTIEAWGHTLDFGEPAAWLDREVEVRAVVAGGGDSQGQLRDVHLFLADASWITPDDQAARAAENEAPSPFNGLLRYQPPTGNAPRVKVAGTISHVKADEGFFITDGSSGLWIGTPQQSSFRTGDVVTAVGYVQAGRPGMSDAIVKIMARGSWPAARMVTTPELAGNTVRNALVSAEGTLEEIQNDAGNFSMRIGDRHGSEFRANGFFKTRDIKPGARLLLTGIALDNGILLRDSQDVVVLETAPWLTKGRLNTLVFGSAIAFGLAASWLVMLKLQVARQTRLIQAQVIHRTLAEERQRISRELHDSLEQHLAGLHLQIDTLRNRMPDAPEPIRRIVETSAKLLEHCREETRRSVFELRTQTLLREGLSAALQSMAAETSCAGGQRIWSETSGVATRLDPAIEFHLLRCAQEAVTNALKHSAAREIRIGLEHLPHESRLVISDDGNGFDPAVPPTDLRPHFGLLHLRERAARIKARLSIDSVPGAGTTITLTVRTA